MSKYLGIAIGTVVVILGFHGLCLWWGDFLAILKGSLPAIFILGGAIAVTAGISEIKDEISSKKEKTG
jgi:hypothetical protein